jgi:hypothetical protein
MNRRAVMGMERTAVEPSEAADKKYKKSMGPVWRRDSTQKAWNE